MRHLIRMFKSSTGYFSNVKCPKLEQCKLPMCVFSHGAKRSLSTMAKDQNVKENLKDKVVQSDNKRAKIQDSILASVTQRTNNGSEEDGNVKDLDLWAPKQLPGVGAPATIQQRIKYISALINQYTKHNISLPKRKAVEKEYEIALKNKSTTYSFAMKSAISKAKTNQHDYTFDPKGKNKGKVLNENEQYEAVKNLVHTVEKLKKNQYATEIPTEYLYEVKDRNLKKCDHCSEHFYFDKIHETTKCQYHERRKRVVTNAGERTAHWECCDQVVGESQGCKTINHHVFKASDPFELENLISFRKSPKAAEGDKKRQIVGLDCEMGYTTRGLEMIRLTIVDFFSGSTIFDEIVKPSGEVLDLNTNWSGVSKIPPESLTLDGVYDVILGSIINEDTIIVGHGLENDLNVMRLVHHNIVDTAILFPKSLDKKFSLKDLSFQFLDRKIQGGEHSSEEDSLAAIDIIKHHISHS
ncbi:RNA exonuclease 3 [Wickerhamomyces ciferrii]|uniref:RNA exonuclease 3 n=1 Tax=Wickerhamomyces ciferrii (strain ATCC 14091 / BCRC 22168 / CBS 111 / JCM 3599 / NBRC 0793 / NRRL Y-1031 F-60-10) TaxID=1206466 RepID=K0KM48_WICCF|nr:RNA exonuclease 3 [Wickerhamomyces ciferrii]CCH42454.1 RNA exonuclease 3 [Wickerhamomyces ciferrii]